MDEQVDILSLISISPACMAELQKHTLADPVMQKVTHFISNGWQAKSKSVAPEAQPYFPFRDELIVDDGFISKGQRVVVPQTLRKEYLTQLNQGHSWNRRALQQCSTPPAERTASYSPSSRPPLEWTAVPDVR